jgi:hypothetical protein
VWEEVHLCCVLHYYHKGQGRRATRREKRSARRSGGAITQGHRWKPSQVHARDDYYTAPGAAARTTPKLEPEGVTIVRYCHLVIKIEGLQI